MLLLEIAVKPGRSETIIHIQWLSLERFARALGALLQIGICASCCCGRRFLQKLGMTSFSGLARLLQIAVITKP
ncbi:hypothetical protein BH24CHL4_BH24CHL4_25830 [soil metagenome]